MTSLLSISRVIDAVSAVIGRFMSWLILMAVIVSTVNAVIRKLFDVSSNAWLELQWVLFGAVFLLCSPWTLMSNEHIRIDIFNSLLSKGTRNWIVDRTHGRGYGVERPLGWVPRYEDFLWEGLEEFTIEKFNKAMSIKNEEWKNEILSHQELFSKLYDKLPKEFIFMRELLLSSIWRSPEHSELAQER